MAKPRTPRTNSKKSGSGDSVAAAAPAMTVEVKKNLVPINLEEEIRRRAYELFQQRNGGPGNEQEDWLRAENEIRTRYQQTA